MEAILDVFVLTASDTPVTATRDPALVLFDGIGRLTRAAPVGGPAEHRRGLDSAVSRVTSTARVSRPGG